MAEIENVDRGNRGMGKRRTLEIEEKKRRQVRRRGRRRRKWRRRRRRRFGLVWLVS